MRHTPSLVRVLTILGMVLATVSVGHHVRQAAGQAAGVTSLTVVSVVADDPADPSFQAAYTYFVDAARTFTGVTPSAAGSETYQIYDGDSGEVLKTAAVGADGTVTMSFAAGPDRHVININDPGDGSSEVAGNSIVTVVVNPGFGAQPAVPTATVITDATSTLAPPTVEAASAAPTSAATTTPAPVGNPAAIYAGTCDSDFTDDPVADLTNVAAPDGDTQGASDASPVATSFSTVDIALDDVLADDHVLVVFDRDDDTVPVACGAIGGIVADDGSLAFGLPAAEDSGLSGVAYLTADGDQTDATVFLAEDLSGSDATPAA